MKQTKRLSIKARVTIWYTVFLVGLVGAALCALLFMSRTLSSRELETQLRDVVSDTASNVRFRFGSPDTERIDFYRNGVSVFLYDTSGYLLAPQINLGVQTDSLLQDQVLRTVSVNGSPQLIYDLYAVQSETGFWIRGVLSLDESTQAYRAILRTVWILFPLFILFAALGGFRITASAFQPVARMTDTAERIGSGHDLSRRVELSGPEDELTRLAGTLNRMLSRLQASFERERQFTSDVSHELRTPLSIIRAQCEYALSPDTPENERQTALVSISRQAARMSDMTEQLLLLTRADRGVFVPDLRQLDFSALTENCCLDLEPAAEAAGLSFQYDIEPGIFLTGDETLLHRLISNLLTNAIRYNKSDGSIRLTLCRKDRDSHAPQIVLRVADTGIGMEPSVLSKIWDRFYRAETSRHTDGSGLGLSMVKWIAALHGASVSAESRIGTGSCFTVCFPDTAPDASKQDSVCM